VLGCAAWLASRQELEKHNYNRKYIEANLAAFVSVLVCYTSATG
jgi:hypothetical protein